MATQEVITLFLASPGDVTSERASVRKVVDECNDSIGKAHGVRVEVKGWDTDARPAWGKDGQALINEQIADMKNHALFVGILWNRFGTKTPRAASGTREEYDLALKARSVTRGKRPEIMFYFGSAPLDARSQADLDQKSAVLKFKAEIEKKKSGLYWTFKNTADFEALFRSHYSKWLNDTVAARPVTKRAPVVKVPASPAKSPATAAKPTTQKPSIARSKAPAPKRILLDGDVFIVEDVREIGTNWTMTVRPKTPAEDKKIRELQSKFLRSNSHGFSLAYQLQAGKSSVNKAGERGNDDKGDYWKLDLHFNPARIATGGLVNYQNMSADEIAEQRAKWLLLGQEPDLPAPRNAWETPDKFLLQHIKGHGADATPIFPALWKKVGQSSALFAPIATLVAVERLLNGEVCGHIEELKIGAASRGQVKVKFRGTRPSVMGRDEQSIEFEGTCPLPFSVEFDLEQWTG